MKAKPEEITTPEQRAVMLDQMDRAVQSFYTMAVQIQNHPFIEFAGVMGEYVKVCREAHRQGFDFTNAHAHSGHALPIQPFQAAYLGEKIGCIFGPALQLARNGRPFLEALELPVPKGFDVAFPDLDAPDGAVVDGYHRVGDRWEPFRAP